MLKRIACWALLASGCIPAETHRTQRGVFRDYEVQQAKLYGSEDATVVETETESPPAVDDLPLYLHRLTRELSLTPEQEQKVFSLLLKGEKDRKMIVETYMGKGELGESKCKTQLEELDVEIADQLDSVLTAGQKKQFLADQKEESKLFWEVLKAGGRKGKGKKAGKKDGGRKGKKGGGKAKGNR